MFEEMPSRASSEGESLCAFRKVTSFFKPWFSQPCNGDCGGVYLPEWFWGTRDVMLNPGPTQVGVWQGLQQSEGRFVQSQHAMLPTGAQD